MRRTKQMGETLDILILLCRRRNYLRRGGNRGSRIKEDAEYEGVRIQAAASLDRARVVGIAKHSHGQG